MINRLTTVQERRSQAAESPLAAMAELVEEDLKAVDELVVQRASSSVPIIPRLAGYIIGSGGKRLRPLLTLVCARLCSYHGEHHHKLAAAIEFIHTASLLHDDVVDTSSTRRGKASANMVFGNQASVLVGDFLFSQAFALMVETNSQSVLQVLSKASATIAEGEVLQLAAARDLQLSQERYLQIVQAKTAILFAAACRAAAVIAQRPQAEEQALAAYGMNLGIAFQLIDDLLDYLAAPSALDKRIGDDFREGKITLPVVLALRDGTEQERTFWQRTLYEGDQREGDLMQAIDLMDKYQAFEVTSQLAREYGAKAQRALEVFPESVEKGLLSDIIGFTVARKC